MRAELLFLLHFGPSWLKASFQPVKTAAINFVNLNPLEKRAEVSRNKKGCPKSFLGQPFKKRLGRLSLIRKTIAAINRTIIPGLERNFAGTSTGSASGIKHFPLWPPAVFTGISARFASLWFIGKSFFLKKILFACCEYKLLAAVFTCDCFVLMNQLTYLI